MFNLSEQVRRLPTTPKSRLTKRGIIILGHLLIHIISSTDGNVIKELRKILEKIDVQLR